MSATKFHVNPATGVAGVCSADGGNCPFKAEDGSPAQHYTSEAEARAAYENSQTTFAPLSKSDGLSASAAAMAQAPLQSVKEEPQVSDATLAKASAFVNRLASLRSESPEFFEAVEEISSIGAKDTEMLARLQEGVMQRTLASQLGNGTPQDKVAQDLSELRVLVEDLDPNAKPTGFLGALKSALPGGNKMKAYFKKFESSGAQLEAVVEALSSGKDALLRDNIDIKSEREALWGTIEKLENTDKELEGMTSELNDRINSLATSDPDSAELYKTDVLVPLQQKHQDVLTEIAVARQGYQALDLIRKNNVSLMQTVDRTSSTTVAALRTAIVQSQALDGQRRVLEQTQAVQNMTSKILENSSADLRKQSAQINQSMNDPVVATKSIQTAFNNLYATIDEAAEAKATASAQMAATIKLLQEESARAEKYMSEGN